MQGLYGSLWVDRWRSGEADENGRDGGLLNAKATWALELGGFAQTPERMSRALAACRHLKLPPTLPEFLELCRQAPPQGHRALAAARLSREAVAPHLAAALQAVSRPLDAGSTGWARGERPPQGARWEAAIIDLAEAGDARFVAILREHLEAGRISGERARTAVEHR